MKYNVQYIVDGSSNVINNVVRDTIITDRGDDGTALVSRAFILEDGSVVKIPANAVVYYSPERYKAPESAPVMQAPKAPGKDTESGDENKEEYNNV